jgi:RNA polymerase sigma-70 factor, ECF subfamily
MTTMGWTAFPGTASISFAMATPLVPLAAESDQILLERVARGDEAALERLYDTYSGALYAVAFRISGERSDAEEIVLDTFAQAWRDAPRFQSSRGSAIAWLTMICRSRALDLIRARGRRAKVVDKASAAEPDTPPGMGTSEPRTDRSVERMERRKVVADALMALSPVQREAVQLAYYEGLSHSEIAERLGEPLGTVKTRVRLAMQRLRDTLRPYYAGQAT